MKSEISTLLMLVFLAMPGLAYAQEAETADPESVAAKTVAPLADAESAAAALDAPVMEPETKKDAAEED